MNAPAPAYMLRDGFADLTVLTPIIAKVCAFYRVPVKEVLGPRRLQRIAWTRHVVLYFLRRRTAVSTTQAAQAIGRKDHNTAIYGVRRVEDAMAVYPEIQREIEALDAELRK